VRKTPNNRFSERYPLLHRVTLPYSWKRKELDRRECTAQFERLDRLLHEAVDILPNAGMYLNSRQHDARVLSVERTARDFIMWMEDAQVRFFSRTLDSISSVRLQNSQGVYPLGFKFCDVSSLSISRVNNNDKILPLSVPKYLPRLDEFHYDEVTSIRPDLFSMGMLILANPARGPVVDVLLVEVKCRRLEFIEGQRAPFEANYGEHYPELYDAFQSARREKHQYFHGYNEMRDFVLELFGDQVRGPRQSPNCE